MVMKMSTPLSCLRTSGVDLRTDYEEERLRD